MAQISLYVDDPTANRLNATARARNCSISKYVAGIISAQFSEEDADEARKKQLLKELRGAIHDPSFVEPSEIPWEPDELILTPEAWFAAGEEVRAEVYDGVLVDMAAPSINHQRVSGNIFAWFREILGRSGCEPILSPSLVLDREKANFFIPDLVVVCDSSMITDQAVEGAPAAIVEVLSPSTEKRDTLFKNNIYARYGVGQYWLVDIEEKEIYTGILKDSVYEFKRLGLGDTVTVTFGRADGAEIPVDLIFDGII
jgi:Uma2 family endonuclease